MKNVWWLLLISVHGFAQQTDGYSTSTAPQYVGITGNPFFMKDWSEGVIRFSSGKVTDKFKLKFNTAQNRLMLQFNGSMFAAESGINEFVLYTKNKKDSFVFRKGFPTIDRGNEETFYQVLDNGHATLLRLATKDIIEEKEVLASKPSRRLQDVEFFYLFKDGVMHKIDRDVTLLQDILSDKKAELEIYISSEQLKMRSTEDMVKLVKKYNTLVQ